MSKEITGIILAGGKSTRMCTNKALLPLFNTTIIEHIYNILKPVCKEILISSNSNEYKFLNCPTIPDKIKDIGPISGILSTLEVSKSDQNIILSCDVPLVTTVFLKFLLSNTSNYDTTIPVVNNFAEPLIGIYSKKIIPIIENEIKQKNFSIYKMLKKVNCNFLEINEKTYIFGKNMFLNINNFEEYENLKKLVYEN